MKDSGKRAFSRVIDYRRFFRYSLVVKAPLARNFPLPFLPCLWHLEGMPKRSSKDLNQLAASIVAKTTEGDKNPAAVALGRLGGLKGGVARAKKLSTKKRIEIARKAAQARWSKK